MKKRRLAALIGVLLVGSIVAVLLGVYLKAFTSTVDVTVDADRAGLLLDPGSPVRVSGVDVGEVRSIAIGPDGRAKIQLALNPEEAKKIPQNATADIRSTTVFGGKFVELRLPVDRSSTGIQAGTVLKSVSAPVEANSTFQHAMTLLNSIDVHQLNTTLGDMAVALQGRGKTLGDLIGQGAQYVQALNAELPQISRDITLAHQVMTTYADVSTQLTDVLANVSVTSKTLVDNETQLADLLDGGTTAANTVTNFFAMEKTPLLASLRELRPVTDLLRTYSPELGCTLENMWKLNIGIGLSTGAVSPGIQGQAGFLPGQPNYDESNLPKLTRGVGPVCYPFPSTGKPLYPHVRFDDGTASVYDGYAPTVNPGQPDLPITDGQLRANAASTPDEQYFGMLRILLGDAGVASYVKHIAHQGGR